MLGQSRLSCGPLQNALAVEGRPGAPDQGPATPTTAFSWRIQTVNAARAASLIAEQFPGLADCPVLPLGEGCDSSAFEVGGRWVFRFPKREDVARALARETALLPRLAARLPLAVPAFEFVGRPGPACPHPFVGYEKLPGAIGLGVSPADIDLSAVGSALGDFLGELHRFPEEEARSLGVEIEGPAAPGARREQILAELEVAAATAEGGEATRWRGFLMAPPPAWTGPPRLVHNDLGAEHILLDRSGRPSGVIDWGDVALGDPAIDFAGLVHWGGERLAREALAAYGTGDRGLLARARWLAACKGVRDIAFGLKSGRREYVVGGLRALRDIT